MRGSPTRSPSNVANGADAPDDALRVSLAARAIRDGRVVAHPTEGVWGLACNPFDHNAVMRVLALKGRQWQKGLIVIGATIETFAPELAALDTERVKRIAAEWPGAVTWLVANVRFPRWITGRHPTVAIRVPAHAQAMRLCAAVGGPIVSTSANPAGRSPARSALAVRRYFGNSIDFVLDGALGDRKGPSEIRNASMNTSVRSR